MAFHIAGQQQIHVCRLSVRIVPYKIDVIFAPQANLASQSTITFEMPPSIYGIILVPGWKRWRLKSPASRLFTEPFIQAQFKEYIKAPRNWPLWGEFTSFPTQRASNGENVSIWWLHHGTGIEELNFHWGIPILHGQSWHEIA